MTKGLNDRDIKKYMPPLMTLGVVKLRTASS